jgi:hypothetical protein
LASVVRSMPPAPQNGSDVEILLADESRLPDLVSDSCAPGFR